MGGEQKTMKAKVILSDADNLYDIDLVASNKIILDEIEMEELNHIFELAAKHGLWVCVSPYYEDDETEES